MSERETALGFEYPGRNRPGARLSGSGRPGFLPAAAAALAGCLAAAEPASGDALERKLTLAETIQLAIRNNRDLAGGRLGRRSQKLSLEDAEDRFRPRPALGLSAQRGWTATEVGRDETSMLYVSPMVTLRIPTGGTLSLSGNNSVTSEGRAGQNVELRFDQPLLKGAGTTVGTAGVARARRAERGHVLAFKATVADLVTRTIQAYRKLIQTARAVEIAERSLERGREQLAVNRVLIETGRMAAQDIVQTEASVAERALNLTEAQGALNDARLALIDILDIDSRTRIRPTEPLRVESAEIDRDGSVERALGNRPDYLRALLDVEEAKTALALADNARKWDLYLTSSARFGHEGRSLSEAYGRFDEDYRVGLTLNIPVGADVDASRRAWTRAKIALKQSWLRTAELRQSIEVEVRGAVRDVEVQRRRVELARQARRLAERKLETERIKLNAGLSSNFRLVRFEDDLVRIQNSEIGATIAYLNALTALDRALGTTLDTWRIDIDPPADGGAEE